MPTTPTLLLPYPAPPDPADVPADMQELADRLEAVRGTANGYASLGADGKVPAAQLPAAPTVPTIAYGTTLPASPTDGQEAILVDSLTNPSYQWRFRYNAGSASPYKWEYVGGSPRFANGNGPVTSVFVLPRAGDYRFLGTAYQGGTGSTSPSSDRCDLVIAGVTVQSRASHTNDTSYGGTSGNHGETLHYKALAAAAAAVVGLAGSCANWTLEIIPARVA